MSKSKGGTRERVFEAADALLEQGIRPTQQNVRESIGSGSLTTINRALGEWWSSLSERLLRQQKHPDLPEPVLRLASQTWDRALAYAEAAFHEREQAREEELAELRRNLHSAQQGSGQHLFELQQQHGQLLQQFTQLGNQKREVEQLNLQLEERVFRLSTQNESLQREVNTLQHAREGYQADDLIEARVKIHIQEEEIARLQRQVSQLLDENSALKHALTQART